MDSKNDLHNALDLFVNNRVPKTLMAAQVTAVDETAMTCTVMTHNEDELFDVRLRTSIDNLDIGVTVIPEIGSYVVIGLLNNEDNSWAVLMTEAIKQFQVKLESIVFKIDINGFRIEKAGDSLKAVLSDLLTAIQAMTFTNSAGPTSVSNNVADFVPIVSRLQQILS